MNIKTTLIALVVAIVVGAAALITYRNRPQNGEGESGAFDESASGTPLFTGDEQFGPDDVQRIELERTDDGRYTFERTGSADAADAEWRQVEPVDFPVETFAIRQIASDAADLTISATINADRLDGDLTPESLGLNPPAATVTFVTGEDSQRTLELGRIYTAGQAFLRFGGGADGPVYVVNDALHQTLLREDPIDWRDMAILQHASVDASRIQVMQEDEPAIMLRKIDGVWRMTEPAPTHADETAVNQLLSSAGSARVRGFVTDDPDDLSQYGLADPQRVVHIEIDKPTTDGAVETIVEELQVGNPFELNANESLQSYYAKRADQPTVFTMRGRTVVNLSPTPESLVSKQVVATQPSNIEAIEIRSQAGAFRLERNLDGWLVRPEGSAAVAGDPQLIESLLNRLTVPQERVEFGTLGEEATRRAELTIELFGSDGGDGDDDAGFTTIIMAERPAPDSEGELFSAAPDEDAAGEEPAEGDGAASPTEDEEEPAAKEIVFADGSGVLRSSTLEEPLPLVASEYELTVEAAGPSAPEAPPAEPMK